MNSQQIGCTAGYTFAHYRLDSTLERFLWSLDRAHALGFRNFGLEILEPEHTSLYQGPGAIDRLLQKSRTTGVKLSHFTIWHCCTNLTSSDAERRKLGIRQFAEGVKIAGELGIPLVTIGSDWPPEWVRSYRSEYEHGPAGEFFLPSAVDYDRIWTAHVQAIAECLEIADKGDVLFALEPRANSLISTADSFLRLWDRVDSPRLQCVLDVMHCAFHRESVPVAIKKLGFKLAALQVSGTDGETLNHLPLKDGNEIKDAVSALAMIGFQGNVDVELYGMPVDTVDDCYRKAREILERITMGES